MGIVSRARCGLALVFVLPGLAAALDPSRPLSQLHHTAWRARDGAPSQISALAQTDDGYLWIGSARGLFRFDGVEFERFVPPGDVPLPSHNIYSLLAVPNGLWIAFRPSGLGFLEDGTFTALSAPEDLPPSQVYALARDAQGGMWAGTHEGLFLRDGLGWIEIGTDAGFPAGARIRGLVVDRADTLWVATDDALYARGPESRTFHCVESRDWLAGVHEDRDGGVWLADDRGIRVVGGRGPTGLAAFELRSVMAIDVVRDTDGAFWAVANPGLLRVRDPLAAGTVEVGSTHPALEILGEAQGLSGQPGYQILEDREGSIWVGTAAGLDRFRDTSLTPVELPPQVTSLTLVAENDGAILAGSAKYGPLITLHGGTTSVQDLKLVSCAYREPGGVRWWGTAEHVVRDRDGELTVIPGPPGVKFEWTWEIFPSGVPGGLWVSLGDTGLHHLVDGVWDGRRPPPGLPSRGPSASYETPDGRIWLGYTESRACLVAGETVQSYDVDDGLDVGRIRVVRGRGPHYWFGGELGLSLFLEGSFHHVRNAVEEPFGTVAGIIETADGGVWLNEMRGIVHIEAEEVRCLLADPAHPVRFRRYDFHDGLPGAGQMNWTCSTAVEGTDGRLWFATDGGLVWIEPARRHFNEVPPPVVVRSIHTESGTYGFGGIAPRLPKGTQMLDIRYTALSLAIPERVRFSYRLDGYETEWNDAGSRRQAFYTGLGPGTYRFEVRAANDDGVWSQEAAVGEFSIAPKIHETFRFRATCAVLALGLVVLAYRTRVRSVARGVRRLHEERLDERMRIAHELHDTLLQGVLSASMQLHVAVEGIPETLPARGQVRRVLGLMGGLAEDARRTVQGLRTFYPETSDDLARSLGRIPAEIAGGDRISFRIAVQGRSRRLEPYLRDELYRIGRECLLNAYRHSGARAIVVELHWLPESLTMLIRDDGCGIDAATLHSGKEGHWGIPGMRERAGRIGARLILRSAPGEGTAVELHMPGALAYARGATLRQERRSVRSILPGRKANAEAMEEA